MIKNNMPLPRLHLQNSKLIRPCWTGVLQRDPSMLWLDRNENVDPQWLSIVREVVMGAVRDAINIYPDNCGPYARLSGYCGVGPRQLLLTNGSDGAIQAAFQAFVDPGDLVMFTRPSFAMYQVYADLGNTRTITFDYQRGAGGFTLSVPRIAAMIQEHKPRLVCIPNPDSPTGTLIDQKGLMQLAEITAETGSILLIDEAYHHFSDSSAVPLIRSHQHLMVARSFAKAWGMAGLRAGYAIADRHLISNLNKVRPMYEIGAIAMLSIERILDYDQDLQDSVRRIQQGKAFFLQAMQELDLPVIDCSGNFMLVCFGNHTTHIQQALKGKVLYRDKFPDPCMQGLSRFTAAPVSVMEPVVDLIRTTILSDSGE